VIRTLLICTLLSIVCGCARHVVVKPEEVGRYSGADWDIQSEPNP